MSGNEGLICAIIIWSRRGIGAKEAIGVRYKVLVEIRRRRRVHLLEIRGEVGVGEIVARLSRGVITPADYLIQLVCPAAAIRDGIW